MTNKNWKKHKLSEITTKIGSGATPRGGKEAYKDSGISLIRSQNVLDFFFSTDGLAFIDEKQASKLRNVEIESKDVLLNITGDSVARVCQVPDEWIPARVNQHVAIIRADHRLLNPDFLKYSLLTYENKNELLNLSSAGATRKAITKSMIEDYEISIPPITEQHAIANILSVLDDKIENNLAMNKTLEDMAMALYKHWFVDFGPFQEGNFIDSELGPIPEGWEVKEVGEIYNTTSGGTPSRKKIEYYENGIIPWVKSKELYGNFVVQTEEKITELGLSKSSAKLVPEKTVMLAMYGATVGESSILSLEASCNQAICAIMQKKISYVYIFQFLRFYKNDILNQAVGSAQQNISQAIIKSLKIIAPPSNLEVFEKIELLYSKAETNLIENQTLTQHRDTLLPKLISGEVRLAAFEEEITAAL